MTDFEEWSSFWSGKIKEVELRLMVDWLDAPDVLEKAAKLAEVYATRLVGSWWNSRHLDFRRGNGRWLFVQDTVSGREEKNQRGGGLEERCMGTSELR